MADIRTSGLGGVPKGTTADRPTSPSIGDVFYNGTLGCLEIYTAQGWVANSAPPGIPDIGSVTYSATNSPYNNASSSVAFTPGQGGGLPNSYRATSTPGGYSGTATSSPITVNGLQSGVAYTFTVTGTNNFGTSANSISSSSITANTVPQSPGIPVPSFVSSTSVALTFTPGASGGSAITNYKYSTNGVNYTAFSPVQTTSPLTVSNLSAGTSYTFYIKAVNANGDSVAAQAASSFATTTITGGTLSSDTNYFYRKFTSNANLVVGGGSLLMDVLAVGGGGSSGNGGNVLAGGGAGGLVYETEKTVAAGTYNIVIGAGGASGSGNGANTTFSNITAVGGGRGATETSSALNGGSGGGATWPDSYRTPGSSTQNSTYTGFGNAGGTPGASGAYGSGGGGGAGAVGGAGSSQPGNGGVGKFYNEFGLATSSGHLVSGNYYYAGGGAGGGWVGSSSDAIGGFGGGGKGSANIGGSTPATDGTPNTGGGGGGNGASGAGTAGGSGIVIVRYLKTSAGNV
jgi:hypothetical protein